MKMIFKNEEEKEKITNRFVNSWVCPGNMNLKEDCTKECKECWRMALAEMEVEEQ